MEKAHYLAGGKLKAYLTGGKLKAYLAGGKLKAYLAGGKLKAYLAGGKLKAYGITIALLPVGACSIAWCADGINYSISLKLHTYLASHTSIIHSTTVIIYFFSSLSNNYESLC